jgi:hypothetical protein
MRRINPCWSGWVCDGEILVAETKLKPYIQVICLCLNPNDGESLANCQFEFFNFELREFRRQDIGSWGCGDALRKSPDPKWYIYPCVVSSEGGSLANFYFALSMLELEEDFDDMKHLSRLSSLPKPYTQVICPMSEPIKRETPLQFFYFAFCNLELRGFWQEDSQEVAVGLVDVPRGDVYNRCRCLTPPMFTSCI